MEAYLLSHVSMQAEKGKDTRNSEEFKVNKKNTTEQT